MSHANQRHVLELARSGAEEPLVESAGRAVPGRVVERAVIDELDADELLERVFAADVVLVV